MKAVWLGNNGIKDTAIDAIASIAVSFMTKRNQPEQN